MNKNIIRNEFDDYDILNILLSYGGDVNFHAKLVFLNLTNTSVLINNLR